VYLISVSLNRLTPLVKQFKQIVVLINQLAMLLIVLIVLSNYDLLFFISFTNIPANLVHELFLFLKVIQ